MRYCIITPLNITKCFGILTNYFLGEDQFSDQEIVLYGFHT